jgi:hypothetical protein
MLYIDRMTEQILPEGVNTSWVTAFKLNAWAVVAVITLNVARIIQREFDVGTPLRAILALAPMVPSFLYIRSIARWIRGLDELQRRIQYEAWFFATTGTLLVATSLQLLFASGVPVFGGRFATGLGWEEMFACVFVLWMLGCVLVNRRYR